MTLPALAVLVLLAGCYASTNIGNEEQYYEPDTQTLAAGEVLYRQYCLDCHGENLDGNGPGAAELETKPADLRGRSLHFTQTAVKAVVDYPHYSRETISDRIKYGNETMPPLREVLDKEEIFDLVDFVSFEIRREQL